MILVLVELIYSLNAGAEDGTIGINAHITAGAVVSGHAAPPAVNVYNQIEHKWVARGRVTTEDTGITLPAIIIRQADAGRHDGNVGTIQRKGDYPIVFAYVAKRSDSALGARDAGYTMRHVRRFLRDYIDNPNVSMRTVNGIIISEIVGDIIDPPILEDWDKAEVVAANLATFRCVETTP